MCLVIRIYVLTPDLKNLVNLYILSGTVFWT